LGSIKGEGGPFLDTSTKIGFVPFSTEFLNFLAVKVPLFGGGGGATDTSGYLGGIFFWSKLPKM